MWCRFPLLCASPPCSSLSYPMTTSKLSKAGSHQRRISALARSGPRMCVWRFCPGMSYSRGSDLWQENHACACERVSKTRVDRHTTRHRIAFLLGGCACGMEMIDLHRKPKKKSGDVLLNATSPCCYSEFVPAQNRDGGSRLDKITAHRAEVTLNIVEPQPLRQNLVVQQESRVRACTSRPGSSPGRDPHDDGKEKNNSGYIIMGILRGQNMNSTCPQCPLLIVRSMSNTTT
jgi:hypothetical protein